MLGLMACSSAIFKSSELGKIFQLKPDNRSDAVSGPNVANGAEEKLRWPGL